MSQCVKKTPVSLFDLTLSICGRRITKLTVFTAKIDLLNPFMILHAVMSFFTSPNLFVFQYKTHSLFISTFRSCSTAATQLVTLFFIFLALPYPFGDET